MSEDDIEEMDEQIDEEANSGDPRWINPMIQQNEMGEMQMQQQEQGTDQTPAAGDKDVAVDPKHDENTRKLQQAKATYDLLAQKKNRTLSDEAKFKSAALILAKNK